MYFYYCFHIVLYNVDGRDQVFFNFVSPVSNEMNNKLLSEQIND